MFDPLDEKNRWILDFKRDFHEKRSTLYPPPHNSLRHLFSSGQITLNSSKSTKIMGCGIEGLFGPPPVLEESYPKTYTVRNLKQKRAISGPAAALRG